MFKISVSLQGWVLLFLTIISGILSSCEQDALVEAPKYQKKPAIMCLMSPQSNRVQASVAYTKPYFGLVNEKTEFISDALLILHDVNQNMSDTFFNTEPGIYTLNLGKIKLKALSSYRLEVRLTTGETFWASSRVPPKPDFNKFKIEIVELGKPYKDLNNGGWGNDATINPYIVEFSYELPEQDFYASPQFEGIAKNTSGNELPLRIDFVEFIQAASNKKLRFFTQSSFYSGFGVEGPFVMNTFSGAIYTMDKGYRDFYLMQQKQEADNPFSEAVMFTNNFSSGALGVFGCYDFTVGTVVY